MLASKTTTYPANIAREEFDITEPQRAISPPEQSFIHKHCDEIKGNTYRLFCCLVMLRNDRGISFPSKKYLQQYCGIRHHQTLNKHLAILENAGLIRIIKDRYLDKNNRQRWNWTYAFPMLRRWGVVWDKNIERQDRETLMGRGGASMSINDIVDINRRSNKKEISRENDSFPQPETELEEETAVSPPLEDEKENEPPEIPPLEEDSGKTPPEIERETLETVEKLETITPGERAKTVQRDILSLRKRFGELPVLAGVKCALASRLRILNPGGWIRSHLENGWLVPLVEQMNAKRAERLRWEEEERRNASRRTVERETAERERREVALVQAMVDGLPHEVIAKLRTDAERELDQLGTVYPPGMREMFIAARVRNAVRDRLM